LPSHSFESMSQSMASSAAESNCKRGAAVASEEIGEGSRV
jgi:hypothetical protein